MSTDDQISDDFILPLFEELFVVKERDFSIDYNPLGEGKQKLLMLVSSTSEEFAENSELQLLNTIIEKGLKKELNDVWVVNIQRFPNASIENIWAHFEPLQVIVWGCTDWLKTHNVAMEAHRQAYVNGADLLAAAPLSTYLSDNTAKAKLWSGMQRMFFN